MGTQLRIKLGERTTVIVAWCVALLIAMPMLGIGSQALLGLSVGAGNIFNRQILPLLATTILLAAGAAVVAGGLGLATSWSLTRYRFRGRSIALALLVSPLAVPPYVVAQFWLEVTGPGAPLQFLGPFLHSFRLPMSILAIGLCTTPLCFLILRAAIQRLDTTHEDVATTLGYGPYQRFYFLILPSLRPAWAAGLCLVALYACADFGVVESFGTRTLTQAIFFEQTLLEQNRDLAWGRSALLALVLLCIALPLYVTDRVTRKKARYEQTRGEARRSGPKEPSFLHLTLIWLGVTLVAGPTSLLVLFRCVAYLSELQDSQRIWFNAFAAMQNSILWSVAAATAAALGAVFISWVANRSKVKANRHLIPLSSFGYVLPGPVVALGLLIVVGGLFPLRSTLYGTSIVLIFAYVVRFLPEALQSTETGIAQVPRSLEEAAQTLGASPLEALIRVTAPIMSGSLLAAWLLVFTASMRELPATLLLKPLGTRTLSTEIWKYAQDSWYADMAPSALLLIGVSIPAVVILLLRDRRR